MQQRDASSAQRVQQAFVQLMRWAQRGDVRRSLLGATAETLSTNDITLLRTVIANEPVRVSDLAAWQGVDKSTVTPQVRRLEERGFLTRQGDPADKRAALLTATDQGRRKLEEIDEVGVHLFQTVLDGWSDTDQRALAGLMRRLADDLADVPQNNTWKPGGKHERN
jgi:DNA-binding MarR family transcriptional regulator